MSSGLAPLSPEISVPAVLAEERVRVEEALERALRALEPNLHGSGGTDAVRAALRHGVLGGGKRIRPVLCVAAFGAAAGQGALREEEARDDDGTTSGSGIHDLAVSLELIHAYSLMHDDLPCMDDAPLRRGRPATHRVHGETTTMVAGAVLIPGAALQAWRACRRLALDEERCRGIVRLLLDAAGAGGMVGGQALDLLGEERELDGQEVRALHALKTGALLSAAPAMGGLAAGGDDRVVRALAAYGRELGLAFQIADDVLDATSSAEALGKEPSDAERGKSTYVSRYGVEGARSRAWERVEAAGAALEEADVSSAFLLGLAEYVVRRRA